MSYNSLNSLKRKVVKLALFPTKMTNNEWIWFKLYIDHQWKETGYYYDFSDEPWQSHMKEIFNGEV